MTRNCRVTKTKTSSRLRKAFYPAPLALAIALSFNAHAATIVVNSAGSDSEPGMCTILDAVTAVNTAAPVNGCIAGDGNNDTIDLSTFTSPTTITFSSAGPSQTHALVLSSPVTISGSLDPTGQPLVTLTRDATSGTPAFGIIGSSSALTLTGLQITNGDAGAYLGGGVLGANQVTITSCVVSGNHSDSAGGGIAVTSPLTIRNSIISGNSAGNAGGGVYANGRIEIDYSTISNNMTKAAASSFNGGGGVFALGFVGFLRTDILDNTSASAGGGVYAAQGANVEDSTVTGNIASSGSGGGIYGNPASATAVAITGSTFDSNTAQGQGGGVLGGGVGIENSTITGNIASGTGGGVQAGDLMTNYATIVQNQSTGLGGGADFTSTADVEGTILFDNTGNGGGDDIEGPTAVTGQYNIISAATVAVPADSKNCDPLLSPLADNGGPTQTMALGTGSCAIDAASATPSVATDQRNFPRPAGSGTSPLADIGAYEAGAKDPDLIFADGFDG